MNAFLKVALGYQLYHLLKKGWTYSSCLVWLSTLFIVAYCWLSSTKQLAETSSTISKHKKGDQWGGLVWQQVWHSDDRMSMVPKELVVFHGVPTNNEPSLGIVGRTTSFWMNLDEHTHTQTDIYIYMYVYWHSLKLAVWFSTPMDLHGPIVQNHECSWVVL